MHLVIILTVSFYEQRATIFIGVLQSSYLGESQEKFTITMKKRDNPQFRKQWNSMHLAHKRSSKEATIQR